MKVKLKTFMNHFIKHVTVIKGGKETNTSFLHSIRTILILCFLIPVILIVTLGFFTYTQSSNSLVKNYESSTITSMNMMSRYLDLGFQSVVSKSTILRSSVELQRYYSAYYKDDQKKESDAFQAVKTFAFSNVMSESYLKDICLFAMHGDGITSNGRLSVDGIYEAFIATDLAKNFEESNEKYLWVGNHESLDAAMRTKSDEYSISCISYIYDLTARKVGYIVIDISHEFVQKALVEMDFAEGSIAGFVTLDNKEIQRISTPDATDKEKAKEDVNKYFGEDFKFNTLDFYQKALDSEEITGYEYVTYDGKDYFFIYNKMETSSSMLCALVPKDQIVSDAQSVKGTTIFIIFIASIIAILTGTFVASGISNAIHKTNKVLALTAEGDLTATVSTKRKDEFHVLAGSINHMTGSMMTLITKMTGVSNNVSDSSKEVAKNSEILLQASQNIYTSLNDIEKGITAQAEDAEHCLVQMSGLSDEINNVYEHANEIKQISGTTKQVITHGMEIMNELGNKANDTSMITKTVITDIENLEVHSKSISSIINTIDDISQQTNLLSLNASIEAARAGDAGRGFAVVANEIRKLADHSSQAVQQVNDIITKISTQTHKTVQTARQAENIVESQGQALANSIEVFSEINNHVENLSDNIHQISQFIGNMEVSKNSTLSAIESISSTLEETTAVASELGNTAGMQLKAVEGLNKAAAQLADDSHNLQETVSVFKIN